MEELRDPVVYRLRASARGPGKQHEQAERHEHKVWHLSDELASFSCVPGPINDRGWGHGASFRTPSCRARASARDSHIARGPQPGTHTRQLTPDAARDTGAAYV